MNDIRAVVARGLTLALAPEYGAARTPLAPIRIDRPLDLRPELGLRLDFATVARIVGEAAGSLRELGIAPGERVVVLKRNHIDIHLLAAAIARLGAVPVLLSPALDAVSLAHLFERLGAAALVSDRATWTAGNFAGVDRALLPATVALVDGSADGAADWPAPSESAPAVVAPRALEQPALITHTSGTTGVPKLVVQSVRSFAEVAWLSVGRPRLLRLRETVAAHLLFAHVRANTGLSAILLSGWSLLAITDPALDNVGPLLEEVRPGIVETHPNTFVLWEALADEPSAPLSNVACFHSTFDAVHPRTIARLLGASRRRQPVYLQAYGQSESGPVTMRLHTRWSAESADGRCVGYAHAVPHPGRAAHARPRARRGPD
jgi:acyl-coenzyme A synthetase/AMP-(fatty) acid ligase